MGYKQLNLPNKDIELPNGLVLISGKNSHGKSTILEAILFAFFGPKIFKGRNAGSFITYGAQEKAEISIYFILDNKKYYIYRKWGRKGSITTKLFEFLEKKKVYREVTQFNVEEFFEISPEQAMSTVFVRQGEVEELANKKGAELRDMIIDLFRLNIIDDALSFLDEDSKKKRYDKEKLEKIRVPIERIYEDINRIKNEKNQSQKTIIELDQKKNELVQKLANFPSNELINELQNLYNLKEVREQNFKSHQKDFTKKIKKTDLKLNDIEDQETLKSKIEHLIKKRKTSIEKKDDIKKKRDATSRGLGKTKGRIEDINKNIKKMENSLNFTDQGKKKDVAQCPTCFKELTKEHYDNMIKSFNEEIKINQKKVLSISKILDDLESELKANQSELDKINENIIIYQGLKEDFENYKRYEFELKKIENELNTFLLQCKKQFKDTSVTGIKQLIIEKERLSSELMAIEGDLNERREKFEENNKRIEELEAEILKMKELQNKVNEFEIDIEHITKAKEYVRRFVTEYMVVKRLVKNIALKTDKYIKDFTSGQYSDLLLDLSGTKKTGLSLRIRDNFNGEFESIEVLSGGDRTALGISLRLAISELMGSIRPTKDSPRRNPKVDFLLLDEPLAALDEDRRERILKHLVKSKAFSQIFLITHTNIPSDISTSRIIVDKDLSNGISHAKFEKPLIVL